MKNGISLVESVVVQRGWRIDVTASDRRHVTLAFRRLGDIGVHYDIVVPTKAAKALGNLLLKPQTVRAREGRSRSPRRAASRVRVSSSRQP